MEGRSQGDVCGRYQQRMLNLWYAFDRDGPVASSVGERAAAVDVVVEALWSGLIAGDERLGRGVALVATGGYGRRQLFPHSDVDLLFLLDTKVAEKDVKDAIRRLNQEMWDCGMRVSPMTRRLTECDRFDPENAEFTLALMDERLVAGDAAVEQRLREEVLPKLLAKERQAIATRLLEMTRVRHAKYGGTLFHLEPNVKDCPGGLRDVHVCGWLRRLRSSGEAAAGGGEASSGGVANPADDSEFQAAAAFLTSVRSFLHYRHERDDNTLDWQAQDRAAEIPVGLPKTGRTVDAAYWMRVYFRHARSVERRVTQQMAEAESTIRPKGRLRALRAGWKQGAKQSAAARVGYGVESGMVVLKSDGGEGGEPATDPHVVLELFAEMARADIRLGLEAEMRMSQSLPLLSSNLEEGPALWNGLRKILTGPRAGVALRSMHALGLLDLLIPEFHGIDALVIRDAYHRYTVDEHTFVLIDTLHGLLESQKGGAGVAEWAARFAPILRDLPHLDLLYLAALLHDTGKGRSTGDHTLESARMAESVLARLELDGYETAMVVNLIRQHLEMSAALRRDIFDAKTVRTFAGKVQTPEALRMLTLFTYADLHAVHPDALTPWKAENLWRLYIAASNYLDRSVDEERVGRRETELVERVSSTLPGRTGEVAAFLEGFPERYVRTRTTEQVRTHFLMATRFEEDPVQLHFRYAPGVSELTLVTRDRPQLFATMAGVLAAWGMNIVTADAFSDRQGVVVDSFRFTDSFRTLEMNEAEHGRFVASVHDVISGTASLEKLLSGRRRGRRKPAKVHVEPVISFHDEASSHSTLVEVTAEDSPGLLRALSLTLAALKCNIEVALVDTEGETAIDVFYLTRDGAKLGLTEQEELRTALVEAIAANAQ